jgi:predicted regulator of Ras-like GTPase activity (Roadblock/LC7/MglB family)
MKKLVSFLVGIVVPAFLIAGGMANSAMAQGKVAKATVKVLLENDKVRVYELTQKPGAENTGVVATSSRIVRALKGGTIQRTYADGKKENVVYKTGQVRLNEPGPAFTTKNIGKTEILFYIVQLK